MSFPNILNKGIYSIRIFDQIGKRIFEKKWMQREIIFDNLSERIEEVPALHACLPTIRTIARLYADNYFTGDRDWNGWQKSFSLHIKYSLDEFDQYFKTEPSLFEELVSNPSSFLGKGYFNNNILKNKRKTLDINESADKNIFLKKLFELIYRYYIARYFFEYLIIRGDLKAWIRYKNTGIEEEIPSNYLNNDCKTTYEIDILFSDCILYDYVVSAEGIETTKETKGKIFFKEEDVPPFLVRLENTKNSFVG